MPGNDLRYSVHPALRPSGQPSAVQNRSRRFCHIPCSSRSYHQILNKKIPDSFEPGISLFNAWQWPTFTWGDPTLSSAQIHFTSEFGMGSGGSRTLWLPSKPVCEFRGQNSGIHEFEYCNKVNVASVWRDITQNIKLFECYMVKPHDQLVPVSYTHYCASTPGLSTS